jgi:hypothetical protein
MINIYAANRDELILEKDGTISKSFVSSSHPDANGSFGVGTTTYLHAKAEHVEQWQCAPLRILIRSDKYLDYYDSLDETALKVLKQNAKGEWVLPSITLIPK